MSRDIDAKVAEHVMGWGELKVRPCTAKGRDLIIHDKMGDVPTGWGATSMLTGRSAEDYAPLRIVPDFQGDIASAWRVVERMRELGWSCDVEWLVNSDPGAYFDNGERSASVKEDTAPLAICRAALRALGVDP